MIHRSLVLRERITAIVGAALLLLLIVRGLTSFHAMKKENRRLRAERAELLRQQRADRINTADDRPESPDRREYL